MLYMIWCVCVCICFIERWIPDSSESFQCPSAQYNVWLFSINEGVSLVFSSSPNVANYKNSCEHHPCYNEQCRLGYILFCVCSGSGSDQPQGESSWSNLFPNCGAVPIQHSLKGGWRVMDYLTYNWCVCMCVCVCMSVCMRICA